MFSDIDSWCNGAVDFSCKYIQGFFCLMFFNDVFSLLNDSLMTEDNVFMINLL